MQPAFRLMERTCVLLGSRVWVSRVRRIPPKSLRKRQMRLPAREKLVEETQDAGGGSNGGQEISREMAVCVLE